MAVKVTDPGGNTRGVLAAQLALTELDALMTNGGAWQTLGLGATGDIYLVGSDGEILTALRAQSEDPAGFAAALRERVDAGILAQVTARQHPAGRLQEPTAEVLAAFAGTKSTVTGTDLFGNRLIKAFAPLELGSSQAAVVASLGTAEALAPLAVLRQGIWRAVGAVTVLISALGGAVGWLLARQIARPVVELATAIQTIEAEHDLTKRFDTARRDEIGMIAIALTRMLDRLRALIDETIQASIEVGQASRETARASASSSEQVHHQQAQTEQVASATSQMAISADEVSRITSDISSATRSADSVCHEGQQRIEALAARMSALAEQVHHTAAATQTLEADTGRVSEVIDLIVGISEQTNLLALNAAIESARAGEHGRGFAVVADEVRGLAHRTGAAAEEVRQMIESLQQTAGTMRVLMEQEQAGAEECVAEVRETGGAFQRITEQVGQINALADQVASAATEQSQVAEEISRNLVGISTTAEGSASAAAQVASASEQLTALAERMERSVRIFRTQ